MAEPTFSSMQDHFLVALPNLGEGIFAHSLVYLCEHDENGAMGLIVNRPLDMDVEEILAQLDFDEPGQHRKQPVFAGGPVHTDRGFVLHRRDKQRWDASLEISQKLALTTSLDILDAIARGSGPADTLIALGYAGWAPGQLEEELADNAWLSLPADDKVIFDTPADQRVDAALAKLGINFAQLGSDSGHA
ncbi:YqgE/AlgH family protein [Spongiibacter marinus]|uniref:YqgE/AlgH family protein n=1 Tax=Spongiibacter marinus TaxID=354246 RepID=UPI0035BE25AF